MDYPFSGGDFMFEDIIFKTKTFGGFDKNEVMNFVNRILGEKADLEKLLTDSNARYNQVNTQLFEMKKIADEMANERQQLEQAKEMLSEAQATVAEINSKIESLNGMLAEKDTEIDGLKKQLAESSVSEDVRAELEFLRSEVSRLKVEAEKKKDLERQVGAAMLDARLHSEELVEEAKEKANTVTKNVYAAIGETAVKIDDLSTGIGEIARNFTRAVEEVELRIKALTGDMSKTAQLLITESNIIAETEKKTQVEYDFTKSSETTINPADYGVDGINSIDISDNQGE